MSSARVRAVAAALDDAVREVSVRVTLEIVAELQATTPVDTGWARANWIPSIGAPSPAAQAPGSSGNVGQAVGAQQAGIASLVVHGQARGTAPVSLFVTNGVPYIRRLNDGWSQQAPARFIEASIERAIARVAGP